MVWVSSEPGMNVIGGTMCFTAPHRNERMFMQCSFAESL